MTILETGLFNIICNLVASFTFIILLLNFLKPKIAISNFVCKNEGYQIKIVNKSYFKIYDIKAELYLCTKYIDKVDGQIHNRFNPLTLVVSNIFQLPSYPYPLSKDKTSSFAARFRTFDDLASIITEKNQTVVFMLTAKHGLSGLTSVLIQEYSSLTQIKEGFFTSGKKIALRES